MNTKLLTIEQIKQIISELALSKTDKVTKVSEGSVLSGIVYGISRISQKVIKDIAIIESQSFPEFAHGEYLENIATRMGLPSRLSAYGSSTWVRVVGDPGTQYEAAENRCYDTNGIMFLFEEDFKIPPIGFTYVKVRSVEVGSKTNSDAFTINRVSPQPDGHLFVANEFGAQYGRDIESDEMLKIRIKNSLNILSAKTLTYIEQILLKYNENVLRVVNGGSQSGKTRLVVVSQNGANFSQGEFEVMLDGLSEYLSITELKQFGNEVGVILDNPEWKYIDIDFRCQLEADADPFQVRVDIQTRLSKLVDFRFWKSGSNVEWDDILDVVKSTKGVQYVPDNFFNPHIDIPTAMLEFPRFRGFVMRDMFGVVISDSQNEINPIYYPNLVNTTIQESL